MRTRCWVQVLEPGPSSRRTQLWNINLTFFLVFLYVLLFLIVFSVFFLFCTFSHCLSLFFSIFHFFHCPNNGFACSMLTTVGGVVLSRFWHSLTWNRSTIWAPKQHLFFILFLRSRLIAFFGNALNQWFWWLPFVDSKNASNEQF